MMRRPENLESVIKLLAECATEKENITGSMCLLQLRIRVQVATDEETDEYNKILALLEVPEGSSATEMVVDEPPAAPKPESGFKIEARKLLKQFQKPSDMFDLEAVLDVVDEWPQKHKISP